MFNPPSDEDEDDCGADNLAAAGRNNNVKLPGSTEQEYENDFE